MDTKDLQHKRLANDLQQINCCANWNFSKTSEIPIIVFTNDIIENHILEL